MNDLIAAFVEAYPGYVAERCRIIGADVPSDAVAAGRNWLREALTELVALPFPEQRRGPLELFQEAMRFPTAALEAAGVQPVERSETAEVALPGDRFDLAPASSQDLGDDAWRAHLLWGVAKAQAMGGRS